MAKKKQGLYQRRGVLATASVTKVCGGPGNGVVGEVVQVDDNDPTQGFDIWYHLYDNQHIGHADYNTNVTFGPMSCPYGAFYCTDAVWDVVWSGGGGGGDPHFVGFDGNRFGFHGKPGNRYLLYKDENVKIIASFAKYKRATVMDSMRLQFIDSQIQDITIRSTDDFKTIPSLWKSNDPRMLMVGFKTFQGTTSHAYRLKVEGILFIIDKRTFPDGQEFMNLMVSGQPKWATGIIGQTIFPKKERKPNESFLTLSPEGDHARSEYHPEDCPPVGT
jgi:hypothetical protein